MTKVALSGTPPDVRRQALTHLRAVTPLRISRIVAFTASAGVAAFAFALGGISPAAAAGGGTPSAPVTQKPPAADPSSAASSGGTGSQSDLQIRAQELAGEIQADGRALDELDAAYNAAQIRLQSLNAQQSALRAGMAKTTALAAQAEKALKEQALLAYMSGGAPLISYIPDKPGQDPSLTLSYAEIISGTEKRAESDYRTDVASLHQQSAALATTQHDVTLTLASIRADRSSAEKTMTEQQAALQQVKGQMAVLVSQVEAAQQQAAAQAAQSRLDHGMGTQPAPTTGVQAPVAVAPLAGTPDTRGNAGSTPGAALDPTPSVATPQPQPTVAPVTSPPSTSRPVATTSATTAAVATVTTTPSVFGPPGGTGSGGTGSGGTVSGGTVSGGSPTVGALPPQAPGANAALAYARAQIGKPYQWAAAGPDTFDCSGLVLMAWQQGGVDYPHLAQDQYEMTTPEPLSDALPGDLIFFGTPDNVYHVGIYVGNGQMIDAPETGQDVRVESIYWGSLLGAGRVHT